jgi:hypothetical protein
VSIAVLFDELVQGASAVAAVTPVEQAAVWENGRIFTYTRVRIDDLVAGDLRRDLWIRTMGGVVGPIGQMVEGEPSFATGQSSLVFLRELPDRLEVVARAQGQFAIATAEDTAPRLLAPSGLGALLPRSAHVEARGASFRFARDVLPGRTLRDASSEIRAAWAAAHATK